MLCGQRGSRKESLSQKRVKNTAVEATRAATRASSWYQRQARDSLGLSTPGRHLSQILDYYLDIS